LPFPIIKQERFYFPHKGIVQMLFNLFYNDAPIVYKISHTESTKPPQNLLSSIQKLCYTPPALKRALILVLVIPKPEQIGLFHATARLTSFGKGPLLKAAGAAKQMPDGPIKTQFTGRAYAPAHLRSLK
jgi:hypothetical protein